MPTRPTAHPDPGPPGPGSTRAPWWRRRRVAGPTAAALYVGLFWARTTEAAEGEAVDTFYAAPIALIAIAFGVGGGMSAGALAALVYASSEAIEGSGVSAVGLAARTVAFSALGAVVSTYTARLDAARARFTGAFDGAPTGVLLIGAEGRITAANAAAATLTGRPPAELVGTPVDSLGPLADGDPWLPEAGTPPGEAAERRLATTEGTARYVDVSVARMPAAEELVVHLVDTTRQRRDEQRLAYLAHHDVLTGLFNRHRFREELTAHLEGSGPVVTGAVLLFDLDHFRYVNDTLGHATGDGVLATVAGRLFARLRPSDVLARIGGDEFAVLLPGADGAASAQTAAEGLLAALEHIRVAQPARPGGDGTPPPPDASPGTPRPRADTGDAGAGWPGAAMRVTASVGVALIQAGDDAERVLAAADLAMYEAKEAGRGRVVVHRPQGPHERQVRARFAWGERIWRGLTTGAFDLYLQPIADLRSGRVVQYEALLRLLDGGRTWAPAAFLGHAERLGLMTDVDRYVVERAITLLAEIPPERRPRLGVNLSGASLGDASLTDRVEETLRRHGIAPEKLVFEVTETVAIANLSLAAATIDRLRALGCAFALDDFGVGLSSFHYLRVLPFDILKIDGEFVRGLPSNPGNQVIVGAMIDVAHGLGKVTVAEFVQDRATLDLLRELGCDYAQGHQVGPPVPFRRVVEGTAPA